jgi:hypothetical protein
MYILPDGTEFFLFAKWDRHGNRMGKVLADKTIKYKNGQESPDLSDSQCESLDNHIVSETVLRDCLCLPKGWERWKPDF